MNHLRTILAALLFAAAPAAGQTIKTLGYNTTNGNVVAARTNLTFTNSLVDFQNIAIQDFEINSSTISWGGTPKIDAEQNFLQGGNWTVYGALGFNNTTNAAITRTNLGGTTVGNAVFTATNAAAAATAIGLGTTNNVTYNTVTLLGNGDEVQLTGSHIDSLGYNTLFSFEEQRFSQGGSNVFDWDGDFGVYRPATFATNVTVNGNVTTSGTLTATGNVTMAGTGNTAPNQTASSGSSIMTRDLVGQELANPRNRIQTTYWFGLEGLGEWSLIGSGALSGYVGAGPGFGGGRTWYSSHMVGTNHAGAGLRLGSDTILGGMPYRFSDGGALTMRGRIRRNDTSGRPAIAFLMGSRLATQMWQQDAYGLYFVPQPTNSWAATTAYNQHQTIAVSNVVWSVSTAGTTDSTEPTWTDLIGSLVTNGTAVFRNCGPHTSNNWVLAIGSTNASQVVMTNTGKAGVPLNNRHEVVLKLRIDGTTNTPYTVYGSVENGAGESAEVSLTTTNNDSRQPQFWNRADDLGTRTNPVYDLYIKYFSIDGTLNPL